MKDENIRCSYKRDHRTRLRPLSPEIRRPEDRGTLSNGENHFIEISMSCPLFSTHPLLPVPVFSKSNHRGGSAAGPQPRTRNNGKLEEWKDGYETPIICPFQSSNIPSFSFLWLPVFSKNTLQLGELIDRINYGQQ
jgi:hypothetical protein